MQRGGTGVCSVDGRRKWLIDDKNLSWPFYPENEVMERRERERALCAFVRLSDLEPAALAPLHASMGLSPLFPLLFVSAPIRLFCGCQTLDLTALNLVSHYRFKRFRGRRKFGEIQSYLYVYSIAMKMDLRLRTKNSSLQLHG